MCIQDLAIDARTQWIPCGTARANPDGTTTIPYSAIRVALLVTDVTGVPRTKIRLGSAVSGPIVNVKLDDINNITFLQGILHVHNAPGIFNSDLCINAALSTLQVWEAVVDSDLSKAVQRENTTLSTAGG